MELQTTAPLLTALQAATSSGCSAFHTPGHKRGQGIPPELTQWLGSTVFQADLPELPELDNLFAPDRVILQAQELAAVTFGAEQTWFLANGSTCGIEAAILATCHPGEKIILPRNVHRSTIAALILSGAIPIFVMPEVDPDWQIAHGVSPGAIAQTLAQHPDAAAVFLLYPTYYGVCTDIQAIAQITHAYNLPLLVDEAHAAHFAFHADLPTPALAAGADLTVQSAHKTLAALNQAALLHVQGDRIDRERLHQALQMTQSTSPNYLLLASLDGARRQMALQGEALMARTLDLAAIAHRQLTQIPQLKVFPAGFNRPIRDGLTCDPTRLTVDVTALGLTGFAADEILHQQLGVTAELPTLQHLLFIITLGNTATDIDRLVHAFQVLAARAECRLSEHERRENERRLHAAQIGGFQTSSLQIDPRQTGSATTGATTGATTVLSPRQAFFARSETVPIERAIDRISAELVCPYPPGIPLLLPGERVTLAAIADLQQVLAAGGIITGCTDPSLQTLKVVKT